MTLGHDLIRNDISIRSHINELLKTLARSTLSHNSRTTMAYSAAVISAKPIDASRWRHHRVSDISFQLLRPARTLTLTLQPAVRPDISPLDAGGEHGIRIHYVSCHPPSNVEQKGTVLLIHGFPQTWYQFRRVITPISNAGYHVVVPDYRGAGDSTKPAQYEAVFTKSVMAEDLHLLLKDHLNIKGKIHVVGHDM
jgi:predicted alpha/beta-fold hydrolase